MSGQNPYAPPSLSEPEAPSLGTWQVDGTGLLVKNHVVLPRIDLETGEQAMEMKCVHRQWVGAGGFPLRVVLLVVVFFFTRESLNLTPTVAVVLLILLSWLTFRLLPVKPNSRVIVWEFVGPQSLSGRIKRRKWRAGLAIGIGILLLFSPALLAPSPVYGEWVSGILLTGIALLGAISIWAAVDRKVAKTSAGPPGWLRISPIHPEALASFIRIEAETRVASANAPPPRKRKVSTAYFHRYPLAILLRGQRNPFLMVIIALMKWFRSPQLQRDIYHFSEVEPIEREQLVPKMQAALADWFATHPDWVWVYCEGLSFPTGDVMVQSALIASPDLGTSASVAFSWAINRPDHGAPHFTFVTRLLDGHSIRTYDQPFIGVDDPRIEESRANGDASRVLQTHRTKVAGRAVDFPADFPTVIARDLEQKQQIDEILIRKGYQSEPHEVDSPATPAATG